MFKKYTSVVLVVLALLMMLSISATFAQDSIPRGGTVQVNQENSSGWVRNFNPFVATHLTQSTHIIYDPMVVYNPVDGGKPTYWL
ncbi:MAG: hypothetical protein ABI700_13695, partial [Chloroflexota bacterium]